MERNKTPENKVAAVLVFESEIQKERVLRWVAALQAKGALASADVREFDASWGWPVFYIP